MKIRNVDKFREELYNAIQDSNLWKVEAVSAVWKDGNEYRDSMTEYNHVSTEEDVIGYISLAQPMKIEKGLFINVDEDGVNFYRDALTDYRYVGYHDASLYRNKTSFAMSLVERINTFLEMYRVD